MRPILSLIVLLSALSHGADAQVLTIGVFPANATDANAAAAISAAAYAPVCGQPFAAESPTLAGVTEVRASDPANPSLDCLVDVAPQFGGLPSGSYRAAAKTTGSFGPLSSAFAAAGQVVTPAHPCDGTPATTGTVLEGARTLTWCFSGLDANGSPTTVTAWAVYVNTVKTPLASVTVGAVANAQGLKLYQAPITLTRGTQVLQVVGVNAVNEAQKSATFTTTVTVAPAPPAVSIIRGVN